MAHDNPELGTLVHYELHGHTVKGRWHGLGIFQTEAEARAEEQEYRDMYFEQNPPKSLWKDFRVAKVTTITEEAPPPDAKE